MSRQRRRLAGVSLVELMVAIVIVALMTLAVSAAFVAGLDTERAQARRQNREEQIDVMERQITRLLEAAKISDTTTDTSTYFQSDQSGTGAGGGGDADLGTTRITFTTTAPGIPLAVQGSTDDFETQQQNQVGPVGGVAEVSLGTTPVGSVTGDKTGLFLRLQRPSDGDATQGGTESLLSSLVTQIGFRFWDGTQWGDTWDSTDTTDSRRLPAAVQVSYVLNDDPQKTVHQFVVALPASDVTPENPISATTAATPTGGGT